MCRYLLVANNLIMILENITLKFTINLDEKKIVLSQIIITSPPFFGVCEWVEKAPLGVDAFSRGSPSGVGKGGN